MRSSHNRLVPVSLFQMPIVKVKLADLIAATVDFHPDHIVVFDSSRIGTSYKAVLHDGSALTVKRLHDCPLSKKQFRMEKRKIGQIQHPNFVPLLGYCVAEEESLDWPTRLRIRIGVTRGLGWLHHGFQVLLHQNVSSNVVLLDGEYEPRSTNLRLGRLMRPWSDDVLQ